MCKEAMICVQALRQDRTQGTFNPFLLLVTERGGNARPRGELLLYPHKSRAFFLGALTGTQFWHLFHSGSISFKFAVKIWESSGSFFKHKKALYRPLMAISLTFLFCQHSPFNDPKWTSRIKRINCETKAKSRRRKIHPTLCFLLPSVTVWAGSDPFQKGGSFHFLYSFSHSLSCLLFNPPNKHNPMQTM